MTTQQTQANDLGQIRIYAVGGTGINVCSFFEKSRNQNTQGYANLHPVYLDSSYANLKGVNVPESDVYVLPEKDGSGGIRQENAKPISQRIKEILQKHRPMDLNIIVGSLSGGTGSVMGPLLASELIALDQPTICFAVGSDDTLQYINNTINTLKSYAGIADTREKPVVLHYQQNGVDGTLEEVDQEIQLVISGLSMLYSRQNKGLDSKDLFNFLNFHRVTSYSPQVAMLKLVAMDEKIPQDVSVISVASLVKDINDTKLDNSVEFQRVGVCNTDDKETSKIPLPLHFVTTDGFVNTVMTKLLTQQKEFQSSQAARIRKNTLLSDTDTPDSSGMVF